jgi:hypothetical protein
MTCPTCGAFIPADAGFCRACSTIVRGPGIRTAEPAARSIPYPPPPAGPAGMPPPADAGAPYLPPPPPGYSRAPMPGYVPPPAGAPQGYGSHGYASQGHASQGYPSQGYASQGYGHAPQANGYGPPAIGAAPGYASYQPGSPYAGTRVARPRPALISHSGADLAVALFTGVVLLSLLMPWFVLRASDSFGNSFDVRSYGPFYPGVTDGFRRAMLWVAIGTIAYLVVRVVLSRHWFLPWWSHPPLLLLLCLAQMAVVASSFETLPAGGFSVSAAGATVAIVQQYGAYVGIVAAAAATLAGIKGLFTRPRNTRVF